MSKQGMPYSLESETAIIGCILKDNAVIDRLALSPSDFFVTHNRKVYAAALELSRSGKPVDPIILADTVEGTSMVDLFACQENITTTANVEFYAKSVRDCAKRRALASLADVLRSNALDSTIEPEKSAGEALSGLQSALSGGTNFYHIREAAAKWIRSAQARRDNPDDCQSLGIPTTITQLNDTLAYGGIARGHMTVIGAESSKGKTSLLGIPIVLGAAQNGHKVALCTLEDSGMAVFARSLSSMTKIQNRQLQQEIVGPTEWLDVTKKTAQIAGLDIWILDQVPNGVDHLCSVIRSHCQEHNPDLVAIDYLQYIQAGIRTEGKTASSEYVIKRIAQLARELPDTAMILLSQYRKLKEQGAKPTDDDLRDANAVRYYAHGIIHIWEPKRSDGTWRVLLLTKNKNGPIGAIPVSWTPQYVTYANATDAQLEQFNGARIGE